MQAGTGRSSAEKKLAIFSIAAAILHFIGETVWHFKFGQFLPMLIVDYIAISLLLFGSVRTLQTDRAVGLLCGAWGFEFCLNYRTLFNRVDKMLSGEGIGNPAIDTTAYVLATVLFVSFAAFVCSMILTNPKRSNVT